MTTGRGGWTGPDGGRRTRCLLDVRVFVDGEECGKDGGGVAGNVGDVDKWPVKCGGGPCWIGSAWGNV